MSSSSSSSYYWDPEVSKGDSSPSRALDTQRESAVKVLNDDNTCMFENTNNVIIMVIVLIVTIFILLLLIIMIMITNNNNTNIGNTHPFRTSRPGWAPSTSR